MQKLFMGALVFVPLAFIADLLDWSPTAVFIMAALAIIPLAKFLGDATEEVSTHTSPALGGLLNATFGNATELIIGIMALRAGLTEVVKASITGSIVANLLLVLGAALLVGGIKNKSLKFNRTAAMASSTTLFVGIIALIIPAVFFMTSGGSVHNLSTMTAVVMMLIYIANLAFIFKTHPHLYNEESDHVATWSIKKSIIVLTVATLGIALLSDTLVTAIKPTLEHLGWTELFVGAVVIAIIGDAAEHASAVTMAAKGRMDIALQIAIGSATQIALFLTPLLVFTGLIVHNEMNLYFSAFELVAIVVAVLITIVVIQDGESNWLEGAQLLSAYAIIAVAFYLHP